jgi:chromate transporter
MRRDLVEQRGWFTKEEFTEGMALAQLAPGPLAAQLAIYLGWLVRGVLGATLVSIAFVLPSFLMVLAISAAYVRFGSMPWMQGAFYGVGAAVIGIITRSAYKLVRSQLGVDWLLWGIFLVNAVATALLEAEVLYLILGAGVLVAIVRGRWKPKAVNVLAPTWLFTGVLGTASPALLWKLAVFFTLAGSFVFGSGLAIVPFLHGGVVTDYKWLTEQQFLDAVAVAMITPGPVVITVAFIGYLVAGPAGATIAAVCVFLPCYLFTVIPAKSFRKWQSNEIIRAAVEGVTAAATGAIAGSAVVLAKRALIDVPSVLIATATLLVLIYSKKAPEPVLVLAAAVLGVLIHR